MKRPQLSFAKVLWPLDPQCESVRVAAARDHADNPRLAAAERAARAAKRGLWADAKPVPPWEWRATAKDRKGQPAGR